jgi:hypothetical protein
MAVADRRAEAGRHIGSTREASTVESPVVPPGDLGDCFACLLTGQPAIACVSYAR